MQSNEVIVYRVMMYANPLLILQAINYTESVLHICSLQGDSGLTYSISILVNSCIVYRVMIYANQRGYSV